MPSACKHTPFLSIRFRPFRALVRAMQVNEDRDKVRAPSSPSVSHLLTLRTSCFRQTDLTEATLDNV